MRLPIIACCVSLFVPLAGTAPVFAQEPVTATLGSGQAPDLAVRVLPRDEMCSEAELCSLAVHVLNEGDAPYEGPVSVYVDLHAPAILAQPSAGGPSCQREDYGKFRCDVDSLILEPGAYLVIQPEFLFVATALESANACASLQWTPRSLANRDRVLDAAVKSTGRTVADLTKAAGLAGGERSRARLLAALVGTWGEGDMIAANDAACAPIGIVTIRSRARCAGDEFSNAGACSPLSQWCPSNRQHTSEPARCVCPPAVAHWNAETSKCEAQPARLTCPAPETDPTRSCRCPPERPILNAASGNCVAVETTVSAVPPPEPVPGPIEAASPPPEPEPALVEAAPLPREPSKPIAESSDGEINDRPSRPKPRTAARRKPAEATAVEPRRRPPAAKRPAAGRATASTAGTGKRRCRRLQIWGPNLRRCVPFPVYLMGRLFAPGKAALECPAGQRVVNGRCRKR
jgi:hypothetical protein